MTSVSLHAEAEQLDQFATEAAAVCGAKFLQTLEFTAAAVAKRQTANRLAAIEADEARLLDEAADADLAAVDAENQTTVLLAEAAKNAPSLRELDAAAAAVNELAARVSSLEDERAIAKLEGRRDAVREAASELERLRARLDSAAARQKQLEERDAEAARLRLEAERFSAERERLLDEAARLRSEAATCRLRAARALEQQDAIRRGALASMQRETERPGGIDLSPGGWSRAASGVLVGQDGWIVNEANGAVARLG